MTIDRALELADGNFMTAYGSEYQDYALESDEGGVCQSVRLVASALWRKFIFAKLPVISQQRHTATRKGKEVAFGE